LISGSIVKPTIQLEIWNCPTVSGTKSNQQF